MKLFGAIEFDEDLVNKKYVDENKGVFVAVYEQTTYADVKAAIDAHKAIVLDMPANNNQFCVTYSTYTNGGNALMYAIFKMNNRLTFMTVSLTPQNRWTISHTDLQEQLVSGTNLKTVNGQSLLGSGNIDAGAEFSIDTASNSGMVGQGNDYLGVDLNAADNLVISLTKPGEYAASMSVPTSNNVSAQVSNLQAQIDALGEPFRVKQWAANVNVSMPTCTTDIDNTSIAKTTFTISGQEGIDFQILGMLAYEVFGADGKRINCWPICQFTGNGQKELGVRWMCGGTTAKTATKISAWVLLKHR